jgi:hypothetical protein
MYENRCSVFHEIDEENEHYDEQIHELDEGLINWVANSLPSQPPFLYINAPLQV